VESLSAYARQFLEMMQKPDVDQIEGLSPAISIEQKTTSRNPRSTVGTVTEIYDYMRLLWARVGIPYSPATGLPIESQTVSQMVDRVMALPEGTRLYLLAPDRARRKGEYRKEFAELMKQGFQRVKIDGTFTRSPTRRRSTRSSSTTSTWWWTASWCARICDAAGRQFRDRAEAGRRASPSRKRRQERVAETESPSASFSSEVRLPGFRLHHPGDRAAAVFVQQPAGRLPRPATALAPSWSSSRPGGAGQERCRCAGAIAPGPTPPRPITPQTLEASAGTTVSMATPWSDLPKRCRTPSCSAPARKHHLRL
jgi:hypothetical protein